MAVNVVLNGVSYSIPDPGDTAWGQDLTDYFVAQASGLLQKAGGTFSLTAEVDFGATYGLKSTYFKSRNANVAAAGQLRLGNLESVSWRNAANSADLALKVNASNLLEFNGTAIQPAGNYISALTGDVTASGPGSVAATIAATSNATLVTLSALTTASALASVGTITSGTWHGTAIAYAYLALTGSVVNADLANMAQATIKGRASGAGTGVPVDLTATQATAILNAMVGDSGSGGTKGLVPAPAAGDAAAGKVLKADGTWTSVGAGTVTSVTFTGDGTVLSSTPSSAVTSTGTVTASLATQTARTFLSGPLSGSAATPTFKALTAPTIQKFTSGSGTYTTPTSPSPLYIRVRMVGGGGGGSGGGTASGGAGGAGGTTTFGTTLLSAGGGGGGTFTGSGGTGGTSSLGTGPVGLALTGSGGCSNSAPNSQNQGGPGSALGGGGVGSAAAGGAGATNTGGAGAGGGILTGTALPGSAGGSGGFVDAIITSPAATYAYAVGAAGTAGTAGTNGYAGGAGGSGVIEVTEHYQ